MENTNLEFDSRAIHFGERPDFSKGSIGDVVAPIHLSSTYARQLVDVHGEYEYQRCGNPTRKALENKYATLENGKYGLAFSSGLAAEATLLFALLKQGDHIIGYDDLYGGTKRLFNHVTINFGISRSYVDAADPNNIENEIKNKPNTKMVWLESPTNPLMKLCDINAISKITKKYGVLLVVDNTFLSPYFQRPLDLGVDVVVHSITKYISGHSDVIGGAIVVSDSVLYEKLYFHQNAIGAVQSPFDSYLVLRGLKTLGIRMEKHQQNAMALAKWLEKHPKIVKVFYPGLESHPQFELAKKQASGFGGMISFEIKGGIPEVKRFLENLKLIVLAESLGGVESLIEQPSLMSHSSMTSEERKEAGINDSLIRFSVGIEDLTDIIADLERGLAFI